MVISSGSWSVKCRILLPVFKHILFDYYVSDPRILLIFLANIQTFRTIQYCVVSVFQFVCILISQQQQMILAQWGKILTVLFCSMCNCCHFHKDSLCRWICNPLWNAKICFIYDMVECIQLWPLIFKWFALETYSGKCSPLKILLPLISQRVRNEGKTAQNQNGLS